MATEIDILIERLGGLAGVGLPGSRMRSAGRLPAAALSEADRRAVDRLFGPAAGGRSHASPVRDGFRYRLTRTAPGGQPEVVEDVPEARVPRALLDCIRDELL